MFEVGQRWYSEGEPELGLGIVQSIETRLVYILYPLSGEKRTYNIKSSPLKRFVLNSGDKLKTESGEELLIDEVQDNNGIHFYLCGDAVIPEMNLQSKIDLHGPQDRFFAKNFDKKNYNNVRYETYLNFRKYQSFPYKGFLGPKVRLIPHQMYVANEILNMPSPKAMLCDEVGLGKTIEACLVLNGLLKRQRIKNFLIIVPDSLVNQWFVELYKKFNIKCSILNLLDNQEELASADYLILGKNQVIESEQISHLIFEKKWDMLILDEAHQINFSKTSDAFTTGLININDKSFATLLLSATPEVLGEKNLYLQLNYLEPSKFTSFEEFQKLHQESLFLSKLITSDDLINNKKLESYFTKEEIKSFTSEKEIIKALIDRYGTGRNYFRNSRSNLEKYHRLFTDRILKPYALTVTGKLSDKTVFDAKLAQIHEILTDAKDKKVLIICHSKEIVLKLQRDLLKLANYKLSVFHSDQSLLERDRQAAYFADEGGADILICTEIGSEGRNFEFSSELILFDLPKLPDQLEQRIGRLDRIGQMNDINIHIPYIKNTFEDILFKWYHQVLNAFESSPKGAHKFYTEHRDALISLIESPFSHDKLDQFIDFTASEFTNYSLELEQGKDLIIEQNSFQFEDAKKIVSEIREYEELNSPVHFLENVCECLGINFEEHSSFTHFICPTDNMLISAFAGLDQEGQTISFDRDHSIKYEQIQLCSWEHPFIEGAFDLFINSPLGNITCVQTDELPRNIYFEFIMSLQCLDEFKHKSSLYLPFTPLRLLLDVNKTDITKKIAKKQIDEVVENLDENKLPLLDQIPKDHFKDILKSALTLIKPRMQVYIEKSIKEVDLSFQHELNRAKSLKIKDEDKQLLVDEINKDKNSIISSIYNAKSTLDSIRIILPNS